MKEWAWIRKLKQTEGYRFVQEIVVLVIRKQILRSAAALSYFLTLSIFPFLICLSWMLGNFHFDIVRLLEYAPGGLIPYSTLEVVVEYLDYVSGTESHLMLYAGLVLMLTTSSGAFRTVLNAMNDIYGKKRYHGIWNYLFSWMYSLFFLIAVYVSVVLVMVGNDAFSFVRAFLHLNPAVDEWLWLRYPLFFVFLLGIIYLVYRFAVPIEKPRIRVGVGALVTAFALVAVSIFFSLFIDFSVKYSLVYGSLASVIVLMLWLYLCSNVILLGAVLNSVLARRRKKRGKE